MSETEPNAPIRYSAAERDLRDHVHTYWRSYALQGAASLLLGILAIAAPFAATFATVLFFGILLLVAGLFGLVGAFTMRGAAGRGTSLLLAVLVILLALAMLFDPFAGAVSLTVLLAIFLVLSAFTNFALARAMRERGGGTTLLYLAAGLNVALALFLVIGLPGTAVFAIGLFLGLSFVMSGAATLLAALSARGGA